MHENGRGPGVDVISRILCVLQRVYGLTAVTSPEEDG